VCSIQHYVTKWFSPGTLVSSTNKIDRYNIAEILLKVVLNTINLTNAQIYGSLVLFWIENVCKTNIYITLFVSLRSLHNVAIFLKIIQSSLTLSVFSNIYLQIFNCGSEIK
jgi:hypothetical protein